MGRDPVRGKGSRGRELDVGRLPCSRGGTVSTTSDRKQTVSEVLVRPRTTPKRGWTRFSSIPFPVWPLPVWPYTRAIFNGASPNQDDPNPNLLRGPPRPRRSSGRMHTGNPNHTERNSS